MKKRVAVLLAFTTLTALLSGCLVINVEKSESSQKKPAATQTEPGSTNQPAK